MIIGYYSNDRIDEIQCRAHVMECFAKKYARIQVIITVTEHRDSHVFIFLFVCLSYRYFQHFNQGALKHTHIKISHVL